MKYMMGPLTFGEKYRPELPINNIKNIELSPEKEKAIMQLYCMTMNIEAYAEVPSPEKILHMHSVKEMHLKLNGESLGA
ncbi:hypothetical protein ACFL5G_02415 [Candidatus Margulisiibacteriota bacterium]